MHRMPFCALLSGAVAIGLTACLLTVSEGAAQAAPVAGAQTSGDSLFPDQGNGGYDVGHYAIALAYDVSGSITATTTIVATTTGAPLSSYSLDFEGLDVSAVTVDGNAATYTRIDVSTGVGKHKLVITPSTPVSGTFITVVTYSGTPTAHTDVDGSSEGWNATDDGALFVNQPIGSMTGFPNNNTPSDKATYNIALTVPLGLSAVSNGTLTAKVADSTTTTWSWHQDKPMASELSLIAIGDFTESTSTVDLGGGRRVPELTYVDSADTNSGIAAARTALPSTLRFIQSEYGDYPGLATGILVDVSDVGYALETQDRPFFPDNVDDATMTHEFAHQWFGDSVSPCDWNDIWLNEGPATYIPVQYDATKSPTNPSTEDAFFDQWESTGANNADWRIPPAAMTDPADLFGWQVYDRGAMTLEALRAAIGPVAFKATMRARLSQYAGLCSTTADFIAQAEQLSGLDLTAFFQDWVYDAGKPAWPAKWVLDLSSPSAATAPGSPLTYTVRATPTASKVPLTDGKVSIDVTALLAKATIDPATLPAGLTLSGTTLTWAVPSTALTGTSTVSFPAVVRPDAEPGDVSLTARATSVGATCGTCSVTSRIGPATTSTTGPSAQTRHPRIRIDGRARVGQLVKIRKLGFAPGATIRYRWYADGIRIAGQTHRSLRVTPSLLGKRLRAKVVSIEPGEVTLRLVSRRTAPVGPR